MRAGVIDVKGAAPRSARAWSAADVAALHASLDPARIAPEIARLLLDAAGARSCALWALDAGMPTALAGVTALDGAVVGFPGLTIALSPALEEVATSTRPVFAADSGLVPGSGHPVLLVPFRRSDWTIAVAALDNGAAPFRAETIGALEELSRSAAVALGNALEHARREAELADAEQRVERLEFLHDLGAALVDRGGTDALVERLNRLLGGRGLEVDSLAWKSRTLARRVGGGELTAGERAMLVAAETFTTLADGRLSIALRAADKDLGAMRLCAGCDTREMPFLELVAAGVAEVADRMSLRAEVEEAARGAALATERDRIAAGLHDTAGQLFVAIRLLARREADQLPPASEAAARLHRLADLADQGKWEIDHAIDALALFPAARHGLAPALRSLGSSFHKCGELDVIVDVYGRTMRLPAQAERALYRVVHESLANARHTRCSVVRVALTFDADGVHLEIADDGTSLTETIPDRGRPGTGDMRRALADAGGTFYIRNTQPRGVVIEAAVPKERT